MSKRTKIIISFPQRGRKLPIKVEGRLLENTTLTDLKRLWEAEQAINTLTDLRVHINLELDDEREERAEKTEHNREDKR